MRRRLALGLITLLALGGCSSAPPPCSPDSMPAQELFLEFFRLARAEGMETPDEAPSTLGLKITEKIGRLAEQHFEGHAEDLKAHARWRLRCHALGPEHTFTRRTHKTTDRVEFAALFEDEDIPARFSRTRVFKGMLWDPITAVYALRPIVHAKLGLTEGADRYAKRLIVDSLAPPKLVVLDDNVERPTLALIGHDDVLIFWNMLWMDGWYKPKEIERMTFVPSR